jgi:hypothetical protein
MQGQDLITTVRVAWLVLCGMMLFSRFVFQAAGPVWMRGFLDRWKVSRTHRLWGIAACLFGLTVLVGVIGLWSELAWIDRSLTILLILILGADGLLNVMPAWFGHFKERMQEAWVQKHGRSEKASDKHLFGVVNCLLGLASLAMAIFVYWYQPLEWIWVGVAAALAMTLMSVLLIACKVEKPRAV